MKDVRNRSPPPSSERNLKPIDYKIKYKKRPKYEPLDMKSKLIYTKKIKVEEKKPNQQNGELRDNKKNNISINERSENFDEEKDDNKRLIKNNPYSNYMKGIVRPNNGVYRSGKTDSEIYDNFIGKKMYDNSNDDLDNYKNYTTTNDYEIKIGDPNQRKIPYVKRVILLNDL